MAGSSALGLRTITDWHAAWWCRPQGFAVVAPVTGSSLVAAVGTVSTLDAQRGDGARRAIRAVIEDCAMTEGHDPPAIIERANAALSASRLGHVDALALLSRPNPAVPASVAGRGHPAPLVVTRDHLAAPLRGNLSLDPGWAVVLGASDPVGWAHTLLSPDDVRAALGLLDTASPGLRLAPRTLLAVAAR